MPIQYFTILDRNILDSCGFFMVFQPFSDVLSISNIRLVAMHFAPGSAGFVFSSGVGVNAKWRCSVNLIIGKVRYLA